MSEGIFVKSRISDKNTFIYGLVDPTTEELKYIGKTVETPRKRLLAHIRAAKSGSQAKCHCWIRNLLSNNIEPEIFVIEVVSSGDDWSNSEAFWIGYFRFVGAELENVAAGGQGTTGYKFSAEQVAKLKSSHAGQKRTEETIKKFRLSMKKKVESGWRRKMPPETVQKRLKTEAEKRAAGMQPKKRRPPSQESIEKMKETKRLNGPSPKVREASIRRWENTPPEQRKMPPGFGEKMSAARKGNASPALAAALARGRAALARMRSDPNAHKPNSRPVEVAGVKFGSMADAAKANSVTVKVVRRWLREGINDARYVCEPVS